MRLYPPLTCADMSFSSFGILLRYVVDSPHALPRTVDTPQILPGGAVRAGVAARGVVQPEVPPRVRRVIPCGRERILAASGMSVRREFSPDVDVFPMTRHVWSALCVVWALRAMS